MRLSIDIRPSTVPLSVRKHAFENAKRAWPRDAHDARHNYFMGYLGLWAEDQLWDDAWERNHR